MLRCDVKTGPALYNAEKDVGSRNGVDGAPVEPDLAVVLHEFDEGKCDVGSENAIRHLVCPTESRGLECRPKSRC